MRSQVQDRARAAFGALRSRGAKLTTATGVAVGGMVASAQSFALDTAVDTAIDTQVTAIQDDGLAIAGKIWPALIVLAGAAIGMKLFKRFVSKI